MAIAGYFDSGSEPAPYVEARVHLPQLGLAGTVDFLLDTGSDATTLHPDDAAKIPIDLSVLSQEPVSVRGIGGEMRYVQEEALVYIEDSDTGGWHGFSIQVYIAPQAEHDAVEDLPSVLGRDILNSCRCVFNVAQSLVSLEPRPSARRYSGVVPDPSSHLRCRTCDTRHLRGRPVAASSSSSDHPHPGLPPSRGKGFSAGVTGVRPV